jgi:hypothetical protein
MGKSTIPYDRHKIIFKNDPRPQDHKKTAIRRRPTQDQDNELQKQFCRADPQVPALSLQGVFARDDGCPQTRTARLPEARASLPRLYVSGL